MFGTATYSLADRVTWLIDGLCRVIGTEAQKRGMEAALAWAVWTRVRVLGERLIALAERVASGRVRATRPHPHPGPPPSRGREKKERVRIPREFGWVVRMLPQTGQFAGVLALLLREPEMAAVVQKAPREAERILRPLCRLLGVRMPVVGRAREESLSPHLASPPPGAERDEDSESVSVAVVPPPPAAPARALSWLEEDAAAMRERAARWVARQTDAPSTLLPLGAPPGLAFPGTEPFKNRG